MLSECASRFEKPAAEAEAQAETVEESEPANTQPALFASLHPPLVINITDSYGESHFLQVTLEVMARDQEVINEVKNHSAVIRNSLILMYGSVDFEYVVQRAGKEKMLSDALEEIQDIVKRETGVTGVEAKIETQREITGNNIVDTGTGGEVRDL